MFPEVPSLLKHIFLLYGFANQPPMSSGILLVDDEAGCRGYVEKAVLSLLMGLLGELKNTHLATFADDE
jgi:hypothetical protein